MPQRGSGSWQFGHGDMGYLHTALFVRDAARLPVPPSADIPPRLAGDLPDCADVLPPGDQAAAGQQWILWWRRLVGQAVREERQRVAAHGPGQDMWDRLRERFAGREDVFDPPDFGSLADMNPLQSAVIATFAVWMQWPASPHRDRPEPQEFAWPLVREAAESTAADLGIPVSDLNAYAHVLDVTGMWSYVAGPGCALCSAAVARDKAAAGQLLREVFSSGHGPDAGLAN
jgi:hypothetical protein